MVKVLDREAINRMVDRRGSGGVGSGGGGGAIDLSSYATKSWTDDNYVGKEFFSSLFKAYDADGNEVLPNDTETVIDNIKAMFGFWTDFYISALGTGGHQSVDLRLAQLADVNVAGVTNGQVLTYNSTTGKWIASTPQAGTDMATVWANLAANGNQQINASHLTTALTGYATQTWVNSQISDMATQTWVGQNYLSKTDAASTYLSIAFFNRLFKAYNGTTQVYPNNTTTAIDNIKAMFGFWTEFYVSALGTGGQSTVGLRLAQLADVNVAGVANGQVLTYDSTTGKWIASTPQAGTDMATVWANLSANGNQQINYTHISNAVKISNGTITIGSSSITPLTSHQSVTDHNPTLSWSTKSKVATIGSTEIHVIMLDKPSYTLDDVSDGSSRKLSNYLPLSGGTMSGTLGLRSNAYGGPSGDHGMDCNNSDIVGVNSIYTADISGGWDEGIEFKRTNNNWDSMYAIDGTFYFKANNNGGGATLNVGNLYSAGYVTALSDARHKNVIGDTELTVEQIAGAPAIRFTWKNRDDKTVFAGSIAQYWQKILPEVVQSQADDTLSLDYQVAALISSITVARKVVNHESRLQRLERMFAINEDDIED